MKKNRFVIGFLILPLLLGCFDSQEYDFDKINEIPLGSSYALPLVTGELDLKDLLATEGSHTLEVGEDDVLFFHYEQDFTVDDGIAAVEIPGVEFNKALTIPADIHVPANTSKELFFFPGKLSLDMEQQLTSILYKAGLLSHSVETSISLPLEISIVFPSISREEGSLQQLISTNGASRTTGEISLADYLADLTTATPAYNQLPFEIKVTAINNSSSEVIVHRGKNLDLGISLREQEYKLVKGFFGNLEADVAEMELPVGFDEMLDYDINLAEMDLKMTVTNEFGIPLSLSFPEFVALNQYGQELDIHTDPAGEIEIAAAASPGEEAVETIDIVNGDAIIDFDPETVKVDAHLALNKGLSSAENFITDESKLSSNLAADIPLIGSFRQIVIKDTFDIALDELEELEVKSLALKTRLVNQFPFEGDFQVYLLDEQKRLIDSLLQEDQTHVIKASSVTASGDLDEPGIFEEEVIISPEKLDNLSKASYLIIKTTLNTAPGPSNDYPHVKFKSGYTIDVNLGILTELETSI